MGVRIVYAIRHNKTGRIYIGSSERVKWRIKEHLQALRRHKSKNLLMQSDYDLHGEDYTFKRIDTISNQAESWKEYFWMLYFRTIDEKFGYNYRDSHIKRCKFDDFKSIEYFLE